MTKNKKGVEIIYVNSHDVTETPSIIIEAKPKSDEKTSNPWMVPSKDLIKNETNEKPSDPKLSDPESLNEYLEPDDLEYVEDILPYGNQISLSLNNSNVGNSGDGSRVGRELTEYSDCEQCPEGSGKSLNMHVDIWRDIKLLYNMFLPNEFAIYLLMTESHGVYNVYDYVIPDHKRSGGHVDIPVDQAPGSLIGHLHSHANMNAFWSHTDRSHSNYPVHVVMGASNRGRSWLSCVLGSPEFKDGHNYIDNLDVLAVSRTPVSCGRIMRLNIPLRLYGTLTREKVIEKVPETESEPPSNEISNNINQDIKQDIKQDDIKSNNDNNVKQGDVENATSNVTVPDTNIVKVAKFLIGEKTVEGIKRIKNTDTLSIITPIFVKPKPENVTVKPNNTEVKLDVTLHKTLPTPTNAAELDKSISDEIKNAREPVRRTFRQI